MNVLKNFPYSHTEHYTYVYTLHLTQMYLSIDGVACKSMLLITIIRTLQLESYVFCTFMIQMSPICVILYLIGTQLFNVQSTLWFPIFKLMFEGRNIFCWTVPNRTSATMSYVDINIYCLAGGFYCISDQFVYFHFPSKIDIYTTASVVGIF
jgi:hypothetical protein